MTTPSLPAGDAGLLRQLLLEKYEPIAIVGMGLRLPGGNDDPAQFAGFLRAGRSGTGPIPADRWDVAGLFTENPLEKGKIRTAGGGFLADIAGFDSGFFHISPREADYIDPQHRVALEVAWHALESANIDPAPLRGGDGGVYLGVALMDYVIAAGAVAPADMDAYIGTGTAHSALPGRISYFLGWRGPSMSIDTACSSSLVALHLAVCALRRRECTIALAGGVNLIHQPRNHIAFSQANMLARDGRCKTFDDSADGYSRSEGCAIFALKRLSDAKADGDRIFALVRGSAVRQDGERSGLTVPNGVAQAAVMREALASALLSPSDIGYVEAHGTGTPLGDPIEMGAIDAVFGASRGGGDPVVVGSVKTNIGHMEAAAGAGGVLKAVLQLDRGMIFPHINLEKPSRRIPWDRYRVKVATTAQPWGGATRRALVNSFGFAGTIAAVVLEQAPPFSRPAGEQAPGHLYAAVRAPGARAPGARDAGEGDAGARAAGGHGPGELPIFTLSARTHAALRLQAQRYRRFLRDQPGAQIADLCYTSNTGRSHLDARLARTVSSRAELDLALGDYLARPAAAHERDGGSRGSAATVAFLCTGEGPCPHGTARALCRRYPVFREHAGECAALFSRLLGCPAAALAPGGHCDPEPGDGQAPCGQPAVFTLEYALARLWMSWGVRPGILLGHGTGEVVAATIAGLFTLQDAVALVAARARAACPAACPAPAGGPAGDVREALEAARFREPEIALVSSITGELADFAGAGTAGYWARQAGAPARLAAALASVTGRGRHIFIEVGPCGPLTEVGRRAAGSAGQAWLPSLAPAGADGGTLRASLARCYEAGLAIDWASVHSGTSYRKVTLPAYVFDRKRHWLPARPPDAGAGEQAGDGTRPLPAPVLAEYLRSGQELASAQRDVLLAFLGRQPGGGPAAERK